MSYPKDLDDYSDETLQQELNRRERARQKGKCDYCGKPRGSEPACRLPVRHTAKPKVDLSPGRSDEAEEAEMPQ